MFKLENFSMKNIFLITLTCFFLKVGFAQTNIGYQKDYQFLKSGNLVADKNFYLLTVIERTPAIKKIFSTEERFIEILTKGKATILQHVKDTCSWPVSLVASFKYTGSDSLLLDEIIKDLYSKNRFAFDQLINRHLRPSGYYQRFVGLSNEELTLQAMW